MDAMPDGNDLQAREALLVKAAQAWTDDPALDPAALAPGESDTDPGDSVLCYLRAYYHRVATEDLPSPSRLAAVAEAHAELGLHRPQGRALVQVREPGTRTWTPASLVVDIVTDDMPYLVDSVTTRLNRHQADIEPRAPAAARAPGRDRRAAGDPRCVRRGRARRSRTN